MENMPPGNSFPQICVVSVTHSVEIADIAQDYGYCVEKSNLFCLLISNGLRAAIRPLAAIPLATICLAAIIDTDTW
jgi:ABC-type enterobactin transport system permease subunit